MIRVYHNQTVQGAILVDDIDDQLPNKTAHRLGSTANPDAYKRDGYANDPKQSCYVPRSRASNGFPLVAGYIDLSETQRVTLSAGKGKISKLVAAGLVTSVSFSASDLATPTLATAVLDVGVTDELTLTGTNFLSVAPDVTTVVITGTGAVTLTAAQIITDGGSVSATSIVIDPSSIPGVAVATSSVKVVANEQSTSTVVLT